MAFSVSRPEDFHIPDNFEDEEPLFIYSRWEKFPSTMVISGGGFNDISVNSAKRKLYELIDVTPIQVVTLERFKGK